MRNNKIIFVLFLFIIFVKTSGYTDELNFKVPVINSAIFYSLSFTHLTASYITGNFYLSDMNKSNTAFGISTISNFVLALGSFTAPSAILINFLINYINRYPDDYFNNRYFKVRNALIITLVSNSFLWNVSTVLCSIYLSKLFYSNLTLLDYIIIGNSGYTSGITFLASVFLSTAIIIKHFSYKIYHLKKNSGKKILTDVYPIIETDFNKKFTLGISIFL